MGLYITLSMDRSISRPPQSPPHPRRLADPPQPRPEDVAEAAKKPMKKHMGNRQPAR